MYLDPCCAMALVLGRRLTLPTVGGLGPAALAGESINPGEKLFLEPLEQCFELAVPDNVAPHAHSIDANPGSGLVDQWLCFLGKLSSWQHSECLCLHSVSVVRAHVLHMPAEALYDRRWHIKCLSHVATSARLVPVLVNVPRVR